MKTAGATRHAERMSKVPVWAFDDEKIKHYLKVRFPKMDTDPKQRQRAARVVMLIHLYYRNGATTAGTAEGLGTSIPMVKDLIRRVKKGMEGPTKPPGRPKKVLSIETDNVSPAL